LTALDLDATVCAANQFERGQGMERRELEGAAAKYTYLRGLLYLPAGALFVLAALGNWQVGFLRHNWAFLLVAVLIGATSLPITRYYNARYGRLTPSTAQEVRAGVAVFIAAAVMFGGALLLRSRAAWSLDLPVNAIAVSFALVMLISYVIVVGLKPHHVVIWGTLLVIGALPVWNGADPSNVGLLLAGAAVIVDGIFDHRLFVQTFGPSRGVSLEESDAAA
jgi:hypothetical protein